MVTDEADRYAVLLWMASWNSAARGSAHWTMTMIMDPAVVPGTFRNITEFT